MKTAWLAAIITVSSLCAISAKALAADEPQDFAYALPIESVGSDALYRVVIPQSVYEGVAFADLRDVRVFNGDGEVVPHAFRPLIAGREQPAPVAVPFFALRGTGGTQAADLDVALQSNNGQVSLRVRPHGRTVETSNILGYLVDLSSQEEMFSQLVLEWGTQPGGYIGTVNVEASNDLKNWSLLVSNAPLLSLSQSGQQLERKAVSLRTGRFKYLRLTWPGENKVIELTNISAQPVDKRAPLERASKQVSTDVGKDGDYIAELGGPFPVDRLTIGLPQDNSVAPIRIYSRNTPDVQWRRVTSTVAYRLRQDGQVIENPTLSIAPRAHRYWLFRVDQQGGGIGAGTISVEAGWLAHEIIFAARGSKPFRLAFGNSRAQQNAIPVKTLVPNWGSDSAPSITPAGTGSTETIAGEAATRKRIDAKKAGLWAALLAGVGVLGFMAWRISQQINAGDE
ncbi:MAG: DUF3999 domain-containing protein [Betaproteobacteria bacterium]|jgi:hypothetical protein|nr:MAG: DUF3999 domain-containing protein [Betaproteobacteria bacterium]